MEMDHANKYVRLHPRFRLRGWLGMPYALVDSVTATARPISKGLFGTLQLCNGRFRASDVVFLGPRKEQLKQLENAGVLTFCDEPTELEPQLEYRYYPNHYMRQVQWSLTGKCNYRCRHCYMSAPHAVLPQPTTEECLRVVDQMVACGIQVVTLTGGEPLIRGDFLQVVDHLLAGGIQIATIMTNGSLVTEDLLQCLEQRGARCGFDISFDGAGEWHEWLRGVSGAGEAAINAFRLCREHGFPTGAQIALHKGNARVLRKTMVLLGELGVGAVKVGAIEDEGEACNMREWLLSYDELFDLYCEYLPQFLEDGAPVRRIGLGGVFEVENGIPRLARGHVNKGDDCARMPACATVRSTMYLGPDGFILPCIPISCDEAALTRLPNVRTTTLADALTDSSYLDLINSTFGDVLAHDPACETCAYRGRCLGGCRAKGVDNNGNPDFLGHDPEACRFFLGGYYDRARELVELLAPTV